MPDLYGPFTAAAWTQTDWYRDAYARELSGVNGTAFAGVTTGDLALTVAGLTISMGLGRAHVRGARYERTGTAWSTTLATNTNANPRIDRLVLRRDLAAGTVLPAVLQGTPAATPVAPAVTQVEDGVWELPLFQVTVPGGSGTTLTGITDQREPGDVSASRRNTMWTSYDETSGMITGILAGWSLTSLFTRRVGAGMAYFTSQWTRTGSGITVPADGNIVNQALGTLDAQLRPPQSVPLGSMFSGFLAQGGLSSTGTITLGAVAPGASLTTGTIVELAAGFFPITSTSLPGY